MENPNYGPSDFFGETKVAGGGRGEGGRMDLFSFLKKKQFRDCEHDSTFNQDRLMSSLYKNQSVDLSF